MSGSPAAAMACGAIADIPDHAIFISKIPAESASRAAPDASFDHLFTHEFIHAFHDRKDYLGWYTHSWVEEGMTEAAAELVADAQAVDGGPRRSWTGGPNRGAWDNLKHYDMWNYRQNGAWQGNGGFSALANLRFYFGGISVPSDSDWLVVPKPPGDHEWTNKVVDPDLRYGAAAAVWLILAKALSDDPAHPTFLRRLNEAMVRDGVTSLPDNLSDANRRMIDIIARAVAPFHREPPQLQVRVRMRRRQYHNLLECFSRLGAIADRDPVIAEIVPDSGRVRGRFCGAPIVRLSFGVSLLGIENDRHEHQRSRVGGGPGEFSFEGPLRLGDPASLKEDSRVRRGGLEQ